MSLHVSDHVSEWWRAWHEADVPAKRLNTFRVVFALVWLTYDVLDIVYEGTTICKDVVYRLEGGSSPSHLLQGIVVGCEVGMVSGRFPALFCLGAAILRFYQATTMIWLNDFFYYSVTALLMAIAYFDADRFSRSPNLVKGWIVDVMRVQLGFTYVATAVMKMNPSWLSGSHLHVRVAYLHKALDWPYPDFFLRCMGNKPCASAHAWTAVILELLLGLSVAWGEVPRVSVVMAVAIHGFAVCTTNVWFFGASIVAHVALLARRTPALHGARLRERRR
ncbi:MAG TPA: HTTM domain-containing protein [Polyangium sp.]|nr:HTTM domain-containing protein [Polyangium sp.]